MANLNHILPPKLLDVLERAGIATPKQIVLLSIRDIQKITNLRTADINLIKNIVAHNMSPQSVTCNVLDLVEQQGNRIPTGCEGIDKILHGGLRIGTLTELYGESGSGKTQIALQAALQSWDHGTAFICTEDIFPVKRFDQMKQNIPNYNPDTNYGQNVFVEHITEANDLLSCVRVRLPKLLENKKISLVILDSVAAPFRSEYSNYVQRAEDLRELAMSLIEISLKHNIAVLCINQVTGSFNEDEDVIPSLGLAWSNMVSTRLWLKKTERIVCYKDKFNVKQNVNVRKLAVMFAPDLPNSKIEFILTETGITTL